MFVHALRLQDKPKSLVYNVPRPVLFLPFTEADLKKQQTAKCCWTVSAFIAFADVEVTQRNKFPIFVFMLYTLKYKENNFFEPTVVKFAGVLMSSYLSMYLSAYTCTQMPTCVYVCICMYVCVCKLMLFLLSQNQEGNRSLFDQLEDFRLDPPAAENAEVECCVYQSKFPKITEK